MKSHIKKIWSIFILALTVATCSFCAPTLPLNQQSSSLSQPERPEWLSQNQSLSPKVPLKRDLFLPVLVSNNEAQLTPVSKDAGVLSKQQVIPHIIFNVGISEETVTAFINTLDSQFKKSEIPLVLIEWNSEGGNIDEGFRLAKYLEGLPVPLVCVVDELAASEAFYLLQSCDVRLATPRSRLMAHEPAVYLEGSVRLKQLDRIKDDLASIVSAWVNHSGKRLVGGPEMLRKKISDDTNWWLNASEALAVGAIDGICESVSSVIESLDKNQKSINGIKLDAKTVR